MKKIYRIVLLLIVFIFLWRVLYNTLIATPRFYKHILLVGDLSNIDNVVNTLTSADSNYRFIGFINSERDNDDTIKYKGLKEFRTKPLEFCSRMESEYDRICKLNLGPVKVILLHDPDLIKEVLVVQNKSFGKGAQYNQFKLFLNDGLLTSEGETWFKQRRLVQPTFYKKSLVSFFDIMVKHSNKLVEKWNNEGKFEGLTDMNSLTMAVIGEVIFNYDISAKSQDVETHLSFINQSINKRVWNIINLPLWVPSPKNLKFKKRL